MTAFGSIRKRLECSEKELRRSFRSDVRRAPGCLHASTLPSQSPSTHRTKSSPKTRFFPSIQCTVRSICSLRLALEDTKNQQNLFSSKGTRSFPQIFYLSRYKRYTSSIRHDTDVKISAQAQAIPRVSAVSRTEAWRVSWRFCAVFSSTCNCSAITCIDSAIDGWIVWLIAPLVLADIGRCSVNFSIVNSITCSCKPAT